VDPNFENKKKFFGKKIFSPPLRPEKYAESIGEIRFLNPFTITGDICNFVTAVSALSNRSLRGVFNYARRPILRTGLRPVQLFLVVFWATLALKTCLALMLFLALFWPFLLHEGTVQLP